jgi:hypothetical protein
MYGIDSTVPRQIALLCFYNATEEDKQVKRNKYGINLEENCSR